ncbi:pyruvate, water dikinase [Desulfococcaceae bacterium OttesenSCG-928-F15]|nr:pyruvate, water dikinase [Desulfococcaceae bacterium OttesenSCG-928-F15]
MLKRLVTFSKNIFSREDKSEIPQLEEAAVEELRLTFKSRYYSFKLLLSANNKVLEEMADIERALQGNEPFSMSFVQSHCTAISVNVFQMIKNMENIAPGKYSALLTRFSVIQERIDALLSAKKQIEDTRLVIPLSAVTSDMSDMAGAKMANLGEMKNRLNMNVPAGFVITAAAHALFMNNGGLQREIDRLFQVAGSDEDRNLDLVSSQIRQLIIAAPVPDELRSAVVEAYEAMKAQNGGREVRMAVRSSAYGEDAENSSFAGQYRSELNVNFSHFFYYYRQVVASKYSVQAIAYKMNHGFRDEDIAMCVGCLAMIDAIAGGVTYTRNPLNREDDAIYINSTWGLPKAVVDGNDLSDLFVVARDEELTILKKDIREKRHQIVLLEEEGCAQSENDESRRLAPSLTDDQVRDLADFAIRIEQYYERAQDIEWAIDPDGKVVILQSRPLQQMEAFLPIDDMDLSPFDSDLLMEGGITASSGVACGEIFKVGKKVDILRFPERAVLVVEQALPTWAPLVARASAIISEQGSFAGHLANVAREFAVPAIFGMKGAAAALQNGDLVTVAADIGRIYRGHISPLFEWKRPEPKLMKGSPVYESLYQVGRHIIPLHLLDPDSRDFVPENCETFHDITRFIHEKSVLEMFSFGKDHSFSERSSKQLHYRVPMNWWILNLDDGFKHEIVGRYVKLKDIASIPMLAFWNGFAAIPWDGPPAMDGKGMASIIFKSTMNPALGGMSTKYADRNYFMISKNYCTLSSRLGYHFSTMEAMVSERSIENYLRFRFKGGAADMERCIGRINFIREILERYGFGTKVNADNLDASMEGYDMEFMRGRLKILGYLTLHTRQLDMIMNNPARVAYYMKKLTADIDSLLVMEEVNEEI